MATSSGACASGCDLATAGTVAQNMLWRYDASVSDYVNVSSPAGSLEPWAGYWVNTPNTASTLAPKLIIPVPGSYMN